MESVTESADTLDTKKCLKLNRKRSKSIYGQDIKMNQHKNIGQRDQKNCSLKITLQPK